MTLGESDRYTGGGTYEHNLPPGETQYKLECLGCGATLETPNLTTGNSTCSYCSIVNHFPISVSPTHDTSVSITVGGISNLGTIVVGDGNVVGGNLTISGDPTAARNAQDEVAKEVGSAFSTNQGKPRKDIVGSRQGINIPPGVNITVGNGDLVGGNKTVASGDVVVNNPSAKAAKPKLTGQELLKALDKFNKWKSEGSRTGAELVAKMRELGITQ